MGCPQAFLRNEDLPFRGPEAPGQGSIERRPLPFGQAPVVGLTVEAVPAQGREDLSGARQAASRHMLLRVPQVGAHDGSRALEVNRLHHDHEHGPRSLAVDGKTLQQGRVSRDHGAAVDPKGFAQAGDQEQQGYLRIEHDLCSPKGRGYVIRPRGLAVQAHGSISLKALPMRTPAAKTSAPPSTTWKAARRKGVSIYRFWMKAMAQSSTNTTAAAITV